MSNNSLIVYGEVNGEGNLHKIFINVSADVKKISIIHSVSFKESKGRSTKMSDVNRAPRAMIDRFSRLHSSWSLSWETFSSFSHHQRLQRRSDMTRERVLVYDFQATMLGLFGSCTRQESSGEEKGEASKEKTENGKRETRCWAYVDDVSSVPREFRTRQYRCVNFSCPRS